MVGLIGHRYIWRTFCYLSVSFLCLHDGYLQARGSCCTETWAVKRICEQHMVTTGGISRCKVCPGRRFPCSCTPGVGIVEYCRERIGKCCGKKTRQEDPPLGGCHSSFIVPSRLGTCRRARWGVFFHLSVFQSSFFLFLRLPCSWISGIWVFLSSFLLRYFGLRIKTCVSLDRSLAGNNSCTGSLCYSTFEKAASTLLPRLCQSMKKTSETPPLSRNQMLLSKELRPMTSIGRPEASKEKYSGPVITPRVQYGQQHKKKKKKKKKIRVQHGLQIQYNTIQNIPIQLSSTGSTSD